ncbi:MAG: thiosulfate oxidation carrier protein SoxY [Hyphomicrobiaceae bacterium]
MAPQQSKYAPSRRKVIASGLAVTTASLLHSPTRAEVEELTKTIFEITRGALPRYGRVKLTLPELAENGNLVSLLVNVDSPMTTDDYVKTIYIFAEKNPLVIVARFHLTPRAGRARVRSNIRLATTQQVVALAEMSDGTFWQGGSSVIVTLAACIDGG